MDRKENQLLDEQTQGLVRKTMVRFNYGVIRGPGN